MSLRVSNPNDHIETQVLGKLKIAQRSDYCSILQSQGTYTAEDIYYVSELVFQNSDIDSLEVLKCFVETLKTMNLTLNDASGEEGETLLFPAVRHGQLESVKHLT